MPYNPEKHHRHSIRIKEYDYTLPGGYFITICTKRHKCLLGYVKDETTLLSEYGNVVARCWYNLPSHFPEVKLDAFVVMPNHIHGIIIAERDYCRGEAFATQRYSKSAHTPANASPLPHLILFILLQ